MHQSLALTVNGDSYDLSVDASRSLLDVVRNDLGLTGSKEGCDDCECGACMMLLNGLPVHSCSYLAMQANGQSITTVEGIASGSTLHPIQRAFIEEGGVQCGYCTPGMIVSAVGLLQQNPHPTEEEIRWALSGNLCRCTGYQRIIKAVQRAASEQA